MKTKILFTLSVILCAIVMTSCTTTTEQACTLEAKICPDGSTVGRNPENKNCEFDPCPGDLTEAEKDNDSEKVKCGGWDTFGEVLCDCDGEYDKPACPPKTECDGEFYYCYGKCSDCICFQGGDVEIPCDGRDEYFR